MAQRGNSKGYDYEMPPALPCALVNRSTWGLLCRDCGREVVVDPIRMVEGVENVADFKSATAFARARCKECGGRMWHHRGFQVGALQHLGWLPRLVTSDGSNFRRPAWQPLGW